MLLQSPVMAPSVWILILNWNGKTDTEACLQSLRKSDNPNSIVLVVDNGSSDDSVSALQPQYPEVRWMKLEENLGFAEGNNRGIQYALEYGASYILLLNNDTLVDACCVSRLIQVAEQSPDLGMLNPAIYTFPSNDVWFCGGKISWKNGVTHHLTKKKSHQTASADDQGYIQSDYVTGCALLVRAEVVRKIGLLDPRFFAYYEDTDWSVRCRKAGWKIAVVPSAKIRHKVSASAPPRSAYIWGHRNMILFLWKHSSLWRFPFRLRRAAYKCLHEFAWNKDPVLGEAAMHGLWSALTFCFGQRTRKMPPRLLAVIRSHLRFFLFLFGFSFRRKEKP